MQIDSIFLLIWSAHKTMFLVRQKIQYGGFFTSKISCASVDTVFVDTDCVHAILHGSLCHLNHIGSRRGDQGNSRSFLKNRPFICHAPSLCMELRASRRCSCLYSHLPCNLFFGCKCVPVMGWNRSSTSCTWKTSDHGTVGGLKQRRLQSDKKPWNIVCGWATWAYY